MQRRVRSVALPALLCLVLSACTGGASPRSLTPSQLPRGGTLRVAMTRDVKIPPDPNSGFDPQKMYDPLAWEFFRCCLLRTLLSYNGRPTDEGGSVLRPDLATGLPDVSDDGLTWTFHIKAGIRYAPPFGGTEIVAEDFVRAMERELTPGISPYGPAGAYSEFYYLGVIEGSREYEDGHADSISGIATPDDHTLVVTLTRPVGDFGFAMSMPATAPIPDGAADGHRDGYGRYLVASGPYMFEGSPDLDFTRPPDAQVPVTGYIPGKSVTLVRNPSWDPATDGLRTAYADGIEVEIGISATKAAAMVKRNELDLLLDASAPQGVIERFANSSLADRVHEDATNYTLYITINIALPPFDDIHVRRALNYVIEKQAIVDAQNGAGGFTGVVATHIAPDETESRLLAAFDPYPFDPQRAAEEMARSRYDHNHDGICDAASCALVKVVSGRGQFPSDAIRIVERDLDELGIHANTRETDAPVPFYGVLLDPEGKVALGLGAFWGTDFPSASQFGDILFGRDALPPACCNYSFLGATSHQLRRWGYGTAGVPSVDDKIEHCTDLVGQAGLECWTELDQYLMDEVVPWVPYLAGTQIALVSSRVTRYSLDQFAGLPALDRIAVSPEGG